MEPPSTRSKPAPKAAPRTDGFEAGPSRVPNWVYTDPDIFAREQERIFAGPGWLYVCLDTEIANPGDFKRGRLGTRKVVAVRDPSGEVNVFVNRCAQGDAAREF